MPRFDSTARRAVNKSKDARQFNQQAGRTHPYNLEQTSTNSQAQGGNGLMRGGWRL